jgi:cytochrome c-type biogenesis protein CcmH
LRFVVYVLLLAGMLALVGPAGAQTPVSDDEVNEVAKDLYCPVCESTPLDVCPTQACADWRELIRSKLSQGESKEEIFDYFARQYGDGVLARPPRRGFNLVLWLFPILAVPLGFIFFSRYLRGLKATPAPLAAANGSRPTAGATANAVADSTAKPARPASDEYVARIERELGEE